MADDNSTTIESALHCPHCGYNLTGLPENRCPECGRPFDPQTVRFLFNTRDFPPITFARSLMKFLLPFVLLWAGQIIILPPATGPGMEDLMWGIEFTWIALVGLFGALTCFDLAIRWGYSRKIRDATVPSRESARRRIQVWALLLLTVFIILMIINFAGLYMVVDWLS